MLPVLRITCLEFSAVKEVLFDAQLIKELEEKLVDQPEGVLLWGQVHQEHHLSADIVQEPVDILVLMEGEFDLCGLGGGHLVAPAETYLHPLLYRIG